MNRKQFILSKGATCDNWTWSWSFVNHQNKFVIFGAWDTEREEDRTVILREAWEYNETKKGLRKQAGYNQSIEHIEYINQGYDLYIFNMIYSESVDNENVAKIKDFDKNLEKRILKKEGSIWFADLEPKLFPNEISDEETYIEGAKYQVLVNAYERDPKARDACIKHFGTTCQGCGFDFEKVYGDIGKGFIHVHHIKPLHTLGENYELDPKKDLIPLCPNCHAMVHRKNPVMKVEQLRLFHLN